MTRAGLVVAVIAAVTCSAASRQASASPAVVGRGHAAENFACNEGPKRPCYFSNPRDTVRCVWTPSPNSVTCELLATKRAYRLRSTGRAKSVRVKLTRRGETLPTNQTVVPFASGSCRVAAPSLPRRPSCRLARRLDGAPQAIAELRPERPMMCTRLCIVLT
jgi:hypothetical protein